MDDLVNLWDMDLWVPGPAGDCDAERGGWVCSRKSLHGGRHLAAGAMRTAGPYAGMRPAYATWSDPEVAEPCS